MEIILMLFVTFLLIIYILFLFLYFFLPIIGFAPFWPSNLKELSKIKKFLGVNNQTKIIDIGSGDGRILSNFCKETPFVYGVEINPFWALISYIRLELCKNWAGYIFWRDFKSVDFKEFDIIFCYLLPKDMRYLEKNKFKNLRKGTKIITNTFKLKNNFKLIKKIEKIYVYEV